MQKTAFKLILGKRYTSYEEALKILKLDTLEERRKQLALTFAQKCVLNPKTKNMFPLKSKRHTNITRKIEKFQVVKARTERLKNSSIPYMQNLLNEDENQAKKYNIQKRN